MKEDFVLAFIVTPFHFIVFDILLPIFCYFDILSSDILHFRYFVSSLFCHFDISFFQYFAFDILSVDILRIRYFAIRYYAYSIFGDSIFCTFDVLRHRYLAISMFCDFDILSIDTLLSIFCDSIYCVSIFFMEASEAPVLSREDSNRF